MSDLRSKRKPTIGAVSLVAAGPGDPDLLTLRAAHLLSTAEVVVCDTAVLSMAEVHVNAEAQILNTIDESGIPLDHQGRARLVAEAAKAGQRTVRLFAGDPVVDGALAIEVAALHKAKIPFEVAPGVSIVTGVPVYAGFTLTGGRTRTFQVLDADAPDMDWSRFSDAHHTLMFVSGADQAPDIARNLLAAGRSPETPIVITRGGTTVEQRSVVSTLGNVATDVKNARQAGPGIVVVGDVVTQRERMSWFEVKPLFGWRVLVPRTQDQPRLLTDRLRGFGAIPVEVPTISVEPPRTPHQMERAVHGLVSGRYEWIGFTSVNAVRAVREKLEQYGLDARSFAGLKVAAVGEGTAQALINFGVRPDLVPVTDQTSHALLEEWPPYDDLLDPINRVFLPRADIATETLAAGLAELGWEVEDVTAYRTVRAAPPPAETREAIKSGGFDAVLFTSSSTVRNLVGIAGKPHATTVVACIGPQTAKTAEEHGLRVDVLAEDSTPEALAVALAAHGESLRVAAAESGEHVWRPSRRRTAARRKAT
ncbi:MAG: bifunctional uroporphyrinogen-III C-methyltransferase/uroporphyrinogen-III synthase [Actinobacteria bacterium]|jgi:uroporphyrinogen III methyltransferase/synthase|nr:bifunctional uroporphyrinogen-III C-methyltransferase/uroporphyrinogen-III synthase [Actinomycetota bacterium]